MTTVLKFITLIIQPAPLVLIMFAKDFFNNHLTEIMLFWFIAVLIRVGLLMKR